MSEWRPIETAPKDGNPFMAWREGSRPFVASAVLDGNDHFAAFVPVTEQLRKLLTGACVYRQPTHWMPLPDPPTGTETKP